MLSDNETAIAYAHLTEAVEDWGKLLTGLYDAIPAEDKPILKSMAGHLDETLEILEP